MDYTNSTGHLLFFINTFIKFFFLLTPFFALTMFLTMTEGMSNHSRKKLSVKITIAVYISCLILFLFGEEIFSIFGITIDAFRIGAGTLLFLTSATLVQAKQTPSSLSFEDDIAVVPLAIPVIVGPATIGAILVMGVEIETFMLKVIALTALFLAITFVGLMLYLSSYLEHVLKRKGIIIISKITGLILAALAAQLVFTGIKNFLK
ncbi:MAG TPA: MarC family protein [Spirochaetota bacterium]|nr:MarC family protein [Spirochaetota bacterium]HRX49271.1 MarC family protein [Spirochaetota bacterium]